MTCSLYSPACRNSSELVNLLRSPIIKADKKGSILTAITAGKVSDLTSAFIKLLLGKERESLSAEIANAFVEQYKVHQGIHTVKLTTAAPVSEEVKQAILAKVKSARNIQQVELHTEVDEKLIGGFVLELATSWSTPA